MFIIPNNDFYLYCLHYKTGKIDDYQTWILQEIPGKEDIEYFERKLKSGMKVRMYGSFEEIYDVYANKIIFACGYEMKEF